MGTLGLIDLAGFVALLLWGLHILQAGVMDAYGTAIRKVLRQGLSNRLSAFAAGLGVTTLLQSSTATGLIAAGFAATGVVDLVAALAIMLGANVGTTLIVILLSFDIAAVTPIVILGGVVFSKVGRTDRQRDVAKAMIGLGLMLFALSHMTSLLTHASETEGFQTVLRLVSADLFLSLLLGALLAWSMHSSIAVILLVMSFSQQHLIPVPASLALVLGANLGSAINPLLSMLSRKNPAALRLPAGNIITRLVGCLIVFPFLPRLGELALPVAVSGHLPATFHLLFNGVLALAFLPFLPTLARQLERRLPEVTADSASRPVYLDPGLISQPALAIAAASREVMRMTDVAESMLVDVATAFRGTDQKQVELIRQTDDVLDGLNRSVKLYLTSIPANTLTDGQRRRLDQVVYAATTLEQVGDIISNNLARRVSKLVKRQQTFSLETWADLAPLFERVTANVRLTGSVFMTGEKRALKRLFEEKEALDRLEARASQIHLDRLRQGSVDGIETSALEIDTLHDLRQINDHLAAIASAIMRGKKAKQASLLLSAPDGTLEAEVETDSVAPVRRTEGAGRR
jgi:phosphate:Na+ symporter